MESRVTLQLRDGCEVALGPRPYPCHLFFFSSRRRHTRLQGDWSSDVCSSDLRSTAAIRQVDRRTLVFYEPAVLFNFGAPTSTGPLGDPRGGFAFHDYCLSPGPKIGRASCRERV